MRNFTIQLTKKISWAEPKPVLARLLSSHLQRKRRRGMGSSVLLPQRAERGDGRQKAECESQKAKALWAMKAARDRDKEFYDPAHKEDILGRSKTRLDLWEEHLTDSIAALARASCWLLVCSLVASGSNGLQYCEREDFANDVGRAPLGRGLAFSGPMGCCGFAHDSQRLECSGEYGPHGELFFLLIEKESFALTKAVEDRPFVPTETLRASALIGLHLMAAESASVSSGGQSPDLGDMERCGCPKSPDWDCDVVLWTESDCASSWEQYEHNFESQSGEKMSLFLEDWALARVALSCHTALDLLRQELHEAW